MDTEQIVRRFRTERQILANLQHPNIAELFEGGSTDDGLPYFVMEYVEGEPIHTFCDRRNLSIRDRLELFRKVCSAVEMAHRNLVVHRDLKPSNILVTEDGEPKLLDFGIAKLLDPETFQAMTVTEAGMHLMTPEYASPEQVRGEAITTSSDVYSLGILLYELLTGHRPYRLESRLEAEVRRVICEEEPERPSTAVGLTEQDRSPTGEPVTLTPEAIGRARGEAPGRLRRRLSGDLDNIVLTSLRKEPDRRYPSVRSLSADLERHLVGLPVRARPRTLLYRASKLLIRRKREVLAAVALGLVGIVLGVDRLEQQRRLEHEHQRAQHVTQFLIDLFQVSDPGEARGNAVTAREILDRGAERIDDELTEDPELRAALLQTIALVYQKLGLYSEAEPLAQTAHRLFSQMPDRGGTEVADSLSLLGTLRYDLGDNPGAEDFFRRAMDIRRARLGPEDPQTIQSLNDVAVLLERQGKLEEAEPLLRQVLERQRKLLGSDHDAVARTLNNLGVLLQNQGDLPAAEDAFRKAMDIKVQKLGGDHPRVALAHNNLALLLADQGKFDDAIASLQTSLRIARKVFGEEHPNVAKAIGNLGGFYLRQGDLAQAEATFRESLAMRERLLGGGHPSVARDTVRLAQVLNQMERFPEAETYARRTLEILPPDGGSQVEMARDALGVSLLEQGRVDEAAPLVEDTRAYFLERFGPDHPRSIEATRNLAKLFEARGETERAAALRAELPPEE
ncbi:MAG: serine/threonine-protein kinase, partial [Acidobacteriota bacterium]